MTLLQIRTALRRQIRDVPKVEWTDDGELDNLVINPAYYLVQKEIFKQFSQAHLFWDTIPTEVGVNWYPLPATFGVKRVGLKSAAADTRWEKLARKSYDDIEQLSPTSELTYYTQQGQWIGIYPAPGVAVADGIQLLHTPLQSLSQDADVPRIKLPLHWAIVWWAKLIVLGDTDEDAPTTRARIQELLGDLGNWYELAGDDPDKLQVGL